MSNEDQDKRTTGSLATGGNIQDIKDGDLHIAAGKDAQRVHQVTLLPRIRIVCVQHVEAPDDTAPDFLVAEYFQVVRGIQAELDAINAFGAKKFLHDVIFVYPGAFPVATLNAWDVVVHFVATQHESIARRHGAPNLEAGGLTVRFPDGKVVCEVYVKENFPISKMIKTAFHEIMHVKLDIGPVENPAVFDMHTLKPQPGEEPGLAESPSEAWHWLTRQEKQLMSANLFREIPMHTGDM